MRRDVALLLRSLVGMVLVIVTVSAPAAAKPPLKQQLVGTWILVSITLQKQDGIKIEEFGPNPLGIVIFERSGYFSQVLSRRDVPKFASNNRTTGTPKENQAISRDVFAVFGTYKVSERERTFRWHVIGGTFPNWNGTDQTRVITALTGNELKWTNPKNPAGGGASVVLVWKRAR